jgi:hypothetical protein
MPRSFAVLGLTLAGAAALACGGGDGSTGTDGVVQLVNVTTNALTIDCGRTSHVANHDSIYMYAHMVNTTASDVHIDSIGTSGFVSSASDESVVQTGALNFTSLPFSPRPATLQARTGDLTLVASVPMNGLCAAGSVALDYKNITANLRITTDAGQYVSPAMSIHVNYVGGFLIRR